MRIGFPPGAGRLTKAVTLATALLLVAAGVWAGYVVLSPDLSCAPGVQRLQEGGPCFGVTDGGFSFGKPLDEVSARIKAENDAIGKQPHVTVAVMVPMTASNGNDDDRILRQLQGAYLAQYRANHESDAKAPLIRLVLANPGPDSTQWHRVTDQLGQLSKSPTDNLRAVAGFDRSVPATRAALAHLTNDLHIPVVGGAITGDDLANSDQSPDAFPSLARVVPTNTGEADALAHFGAANGPQNAVVVEDSRKDDSYITTLKDAFERTTKAAAAHEPELFKSPDDISTTGNTSNVFQQLIQNICQTDATTIYFAGRYVQLRQFINELGTRGCQAKPYTVLTGSEANSLLTDPGLDWSALTKHVTLRYVSLAHPDMWSTGPAVNGGSATDYADFASLVDRAAKGPIGPIGPVDLKDSRTIVMHDTIWTAVTEIRNSAVGNPLPSLADVKDAWQQLHGANKVKGAGGWICLDNHGNPYDKALALVELQPTTADKKFVGSARFVALAWPTGAPPAADCTAPNGT
ncbi:hypothetical protein ACFW1A_35235 [Kitasatospora sp. NPDC058965]|uniref:hypothetical protein n=1 Tax=Kitasatospora sp. NPDC058965 TaxID=3346682 RepID=UPI0036B8669C